ncbi:MAG: outer membrane protein transport protein [Gemmatimonadota bacterium]|nr:outer membrane protein transport protein [Gemmatimonadota bacterium]
MRLPMSSLRRALWVPALAVCIPAVSLSAQGFGLNEVGTCAVSRGFAVTGTPCEDASTIFWNPAAAAELTGTSVNLGASVIRIAGSFRQDSTGRTYNSRIQPALVPEGFAAMRFGKASLGLGVYVPYGLTSQWNDDFPGRFSALRAALQTVYYQPNIAWQANDEWYVGGGPVFGHSTVDLTQSLDLSQQTAAGATKFGQLGIASMTEFGRAKFHGTSNAVGFNVGVHGKFGPWSVGARYLSSLKFNYRKAQASFYQVPTGLTLPLGNPISPTTPVPIDGLLANQFSTLTGGTLVSQKGNSQIVHPWQMQGGIGYIENGNKLSVDVGRIGWSSFENLPITFNGPAAASSKLVAENYNDSWTLRLGAEHQFSKFTGRIGYSYAESPAPDATVTPILPDMNRRNFSVGVGLPITTMYKLDLGYLNVNTPGRRGRLVEPTSGTIDPAMLNSGAYALRADVFSAALNITF